MTTILITGGAGFIGSNFINYFINKNKNVKIINIDLLTYASDLNSLTDVENNSRYTFIHGDICNRELIENLFKKYNIKGVIHFAAESHVDNSIDKPGVFVNTNILGTFNLLDVAKYYWMEAPNKYRNEFENSRFIHISTDEVYGTLGKEDLFTEKTPYAPNSPYSASKASSDFMVRSYFHTYGLNVITTNCSNNYGPFQHDEKLIPTIIRKALANEKIPIYGDGKNVRDWLYVLDHCKGVELAYYKGNVGETYNIGGGNERNNIEIAKRICDRLDLLKPKNNSYFNQITFVKDRPGHDFRYAIDATKIQNNLGWNANENFDSGLNKTIDWYLKKYL